MSRRKRQIALLAILGLATGCHDGPLYALKAMNPYFQNQWAADEKFGQTQTKKREALAQLADAMPSLSAAEQVAWEDELREILTTDQSPQNRFLACRSAAGIEGDIGVDLLSVALKDETPKVRICACQELSKRVEPRATELLAETAGSDVSTDVRIAALHALRKHNGPQVASALRGALQSSDPAFRAVAMNSLKEVTGTDQGADPSAWLAYLDKNPNLEARTATLSERLMNMF